MISINWSDIDKITKYTEKIRYQIRKGNFNCFHFRLERRKDWGNLLYLCFTLYLCFFQISVYQIVTPFWKLGALQHPSSPLTFFVHSLFCLFIRSSNYNFCHIFLRKLLILNDCVCGYLPEVLRFTNCRYLSVVRKVNIICCICLSIYRFRDTLIFRTNLWNFDIWSAARQLWNKDTRFIYFFKPATFFSYKGLIREVWIKKVTRSIR